jgi:hypothetical protein
MATINDLVLVHIDHKPGFYARIDDIVPDVKPGWWQVKLLVLSFPLQVFTWILDAAQIEGTPFTMAGTPISLEKVVPPEARQAEGDRPSADGEPPKGKKAGAKVVSLLERQKEK